MLVSVDLVAEPSTVWSPVALHAVAGSLVAVVALRLSNMVIKR